MDGGFGGRVLKGAAIISGCTMLAKFLGFLQKLIMAREFGTGDVADAYTVAFGSIIFSLIVIPQKLLSPFLPLFVEERKQQGVEAAWRFAGTVGLLLVGTLLAVAMGVGLGARPLARLASDFKSPEVLELTVSTLRLMLPAVVFAALGSLATLLLNADKRFALPALAEVSNKALLLLLLMALCRWMGIGGLILGVVLGALAGFLIQWTGLRRELRHIRLRLDVTSAPFRKMLGLMWPILLGVIVAQVAGVTVDNRLASGMGRGYASSLAYARGLTDTIVLLGATAVGIVLYPYFSDMNAAGRKSDAQAVLMVTLRTMLFVFIPLSVALIAMRVPLIQMLFERKQFNAESVQLTAGPFLYYTAGLAAFGVEIILIQFFASMKNTLTPSLVGIGCLVIVRWGTIWLTKDSLGHSGLALALTVAKVVKVALLYFLLRGRIASLGLRENSVLLVKVGLATLGMAVAIHSVLGWAEWALPDSLATDPVRKALVLGARLALGSLTGGLVFGGLAMALRISEAHLILQFVLQRVKRGRKNQNS